MKEQEGAARSTQDVCAAAQTACDPATGDACGLEEQRKEPGGRVWGIPPTGTNTNHVPEALKCHRERGEQHVARPEARERGGCGRPHQGGVSGARPLTAKSPSTRRTLLGRFCHPIPGPRLARPTVSATGPTERRTLTLLGPAHLERTDRRKPVPPLPQTHCAAARA